MKRSQRIGLLMAVLVPLLFVAAFSTRFASSTMPQAMKAQVAMACAAEKLPALALLALAGVDFDEGAAVAQCLPTWAKAAIYAGKTGSIPGAGGGGRSRTLASVPPAITTERWAHGAVNVRAGRGVEYSVISRLQRGEGIAVDSLFNGWFRVHRRGAPAGYVSAAVVYASRPSSRVLPTK